MAARIKQTVGKLFKKQSTPPSSADPPRSPRAKAVDERSEFEESVYFESDRDGCVSGHGGDVESSDLDQEGQSKQPTNIKKKKKRLGRSKSDSHERAKRIVPSESSGPDTEKECFRKRSKSANAKLGCMTAAAIKPFQKYVGSSGAENRLESDTTDHEPKNCYEVDRIAELERIIQKKDRQLAEKDERIAILEEKLGKFVKKFDELASIIKES